MPGPTVTDMDTGPGSTAPRPARVAIGEIALFSAVAMLPGLLLPSLRVDGGQLAFTASWMAGAGETVLEHLGWGLGIYVPVLLGFYAIVIGGDVVAPGVQMDRVRRLLALTAQLTVAALTPALVLAVVAGIADGPGALFVVVPVAGLVLFLATQLGGFFVFSERDRLHAAERSRPTAYAQLRRLTRRSRRPLWLVLAANVAAGTLAGTVPVLITGVWDLWFATLLLHLLLSVGLVMVVVPATAARDTARERSSSVVFGLVMVSVYVAVAAAAIQLLTMGSTFLGGGLGILACLAVITTSSLWPRTTTSRFLLDWTLNGAAATVAARSATLAHRRAVREITALTAAPTSGGRTPGTAT